MQLFKENEMIQNKAVHIISFSNIEILEIKELNPLHNKLFVKDCFEKKMIRCHRKLELKEISL